MKTRRAFTIVELSVGIVVMMITYAAMSLSVSAAKQTAKHEAERLAAYIFRTIQKADRLHSSFKIDTDFETDSEGNKRYYITVNWPGGNDNDDTSFTASAGCRYEDNFNGTDLGELEYNVTSKQFQTGGTITVTDSQGEKHYVIIGSTQGRIWTDENPPD